MEESNGVDTYTMAEDESNSESEGPWTTAVQLVGSVYYFVAGLGGIALLILIFVKGLLWYWDYAYPTVSFIAALPTVFLFPLGLIFGVFRKSRGLGGVFLVISSLLYLAAIWAQSLAFAYAYAGKIWMLVGFFLAGVGVFFIAIVGGLVQGEYLDSAMIVVSLLIVFAVHLAGSWMAASADKQRIRES